VKSLTAAKKDDKKTDSKQPVRAPRFEYTLVINGIAQANTDVTDFLSKLGECNLLERPDLAYIDTTKIDKATFRKFQITSGLSSTVDVRLNPNDTKTAAVEAKSDAKPNAKAAATPTGKASASADKGQ
jgi:hypothetical protein